MSLREQLRGTGVALITPFKKDGSVDFDALEKLINHIIESGVQYIVSLGTTGEPPVLSKEEKLEVLNFTYDVVKGRVPVIVGIGGNNTIEVIKEKVKDIQVAFLALAIWGFVRHKERTSLMAGIVLVLSALVLALLTA